MVINAIEMTRDALERNSNSHWVIGFSGGKDSSALLKIFTAAMKTAKSLPSQIDIIYCDTGVENPVLDIYVKSLFKNLVDEFDTLNFPVKFHILKSNINERFFVRVIGRGYPTPTNNFRWCTKGLRINPVSRHIKAAAKDDAIVLIGLRKGESKQRDRSLKNSEEGNWQFQREGNTRYRIFLPILDFSVEDVWDVIFMPGFPKSLDAKKLELIYRGASGECPIIKAPNSAPCGSGRFGCWVCTVVRKDKSAISLIESGHIELLPFLSFRNWISEFRNDLSMRWGVRRNGSIGPGPFSIEARKLIFKKVRELEELTGNIIIDKEETQEIHRLWALDDEVNNNSKYQILP
ncbi:phosphoadenosine phosphosulfate reductase family protein [Pseudaquidulcibacter saccharophilus]|uniref:phosphoadenosine phosphosulfate reductase domain-containing protein n=1 Tax=Pseudaquidulcibacter saccharophilus TaxID=2831900 RepID=UPI001EFF11DD|nr:phosphoadenosine phosphosulfate reductase family protein [Pseudaquidulcibacter saccharophilus]